MEEWRKHREQTALVMEGMTSPPALRPSAQVGKEGKRLRWALCCPTRPKPWFTWALPSEEACGALCAWEQ